MGDLGSVVISGASDDLVEVEGSVPGCDEYYVLGDGCILLRVEGVRDGAPATARVHVQYEKDGVWSMRIAQAGEDVPLLPCVLDSGSPRGYTVIANFDDVRRVVAETGTEQSDG